MIVVAPENQELMTLIRAMGVMCDKVPLQEGDAAFEGFNPDGSGDTIGIGVERKTLHDMLNCIDDSRFAAHQRVKMKRVYQYSFLIVEGSWKPREDGILMEGFSNGTRWSECKYRSQRTMYSKLYRYLISLAISGVNITYSRDIWHTAYNICEAFHYFQKKEHTSLLEIQKLNIPALNGKPSLVRKWACDLEGIGVKHSLDAERLFRKPVTLANSSETDWLRVPGIGVKTAISIVKEIHGI